MDGPVGLHDFAAVGVAGRDGRGEVRFFHDVGELEDDAEDQAADEGGEGVNAQNGPPGVEQHGDGEGHGEEGDFAGDEDEQVVAAWAGDFVSADASDGD